MEAGTSNFVSFVDCGHLWLKNYEVFFSSTQVASISNWIEGLGPAHNFPTYFIVYFLILQFPNIFWKFCWIFWVPGLETAFVISPPLLKTSCSQSYVSVRFSVPPFYGCLINDPLLQTLVVYRTFTLVPTVTFFLRYFLITWVALFQNFSIVCTYLPG